MSECSKSFLQSLIARIFFGTICYNKCGLWCKIIECAQELLLIGFVELGYLSEIFNNSILIAKVLRKWEWRHIEILIPKKEEGLLLNINIILFCKCSRSHWFWELESHENNASAINYFLERIDIFHECLYFLSESFPETRRLQEDYNICSLFYRLLILLRCKINPFHLARIFIIRCLALCWDLTILRMLLRCHIFYWEVSEVQTRSQHSR